MPDNSVVPFPVAPRLAERAGKTLAERAGKTLAERAGKTLVAAREAHLAAFAEWLQLARPTRDDAEFEAEAFAAVARQMARLHARPPGA